MYQKCQLNIYQYVEVHPNMHTKFLPRLTTLFTSVILGSIILYNLHPDGKIDEECSDLNLNFPIFLSAVHILGIKQN